MRAAVIGSGIGGLTAAIALRAGNVPVQVYERATTLAEIGAGVSLGANGFRILASLGLGDRIRSVSANLRRIEFHHWRTGEIFCQHPMGDWYEERFGGPFLGIHRADFHHVLLAAFDGTPQLNHHCTTVEETPDAVRMTFSNGRTIDADVVIGADGVNSAVRDDDTAPVFSRMTCYRGLVPTDRIPGGDTLDLTFFLGPNRHLVAYPVRDGSLINFVAYVPGTEWTQESWHTRSDPASAVAAFEGWTPQVTAMLAAAPEVGRWALYDREPLRRWSTPRVTLLGDAAHPMLPHAGQGTNQALEDAAVLAACFPDFARYEQIRKPRTRQIQLGARANAACFQVPEGRPTTDRNARLTTLPETVAWIHGHNPLDLP
ncbi:FAD-dependent monooxygenase [Actinoplanes couchii]|uniref:Salicylate hydroxylase n=1 Tax=Actinoplanes couchii TaxID=403638 RepID=A0ABQ3XH13_9ACTN|nr:FAD-dependent monooxygenase [Actinoplanes couchii]MDR6320724.1 salicylate hydroxylase [Actinoplanes couchii]GID57791.1 salicylate hydroxylase [Actinoplanes couchii]